MRGNAPNKGLVERKKEKKRRQSVFIWNKFFLFDLKIKSKDNKTLFNSKQYPIYSIIKKYIFKKNLMGHLLYHLRKSHGPLPVRGPAVRNYFSRVMLGEVKLMNCENENSLSPKTKHNF